jgi:hypothetical protein
LTPFPRRTDDVIDFNLQPLGGFAFQKLFERGTSLTNTVKNKVTTLEKGGWIMEPDRAAKFPQIGHRHHFISTDVDPAQ